MSILAMLVWALALTGQAAGDDSLQVVSRGKKATALLARGSQGDWASAFCIDRAGFFLTSASAIRQKAGQPLDLVLNSGQETQRPLKATIARVDEELGLALLRVQGGQHAGELTALRLGEVTGLLETMPVTAFMYPAANHGADVPGHYPNITVRVLRIASLRKAKGQLQAIQLDSHLDPGSLGGPLLDAKGEVIGVIGAGSLTASADLGIPANALHKFLDRPEILFTPPVIPFDQRHREHELTVHVAPLGAIASSITVEMIVSGPKDEQRRYVARPSGDDRYTLRVTPIPARGSAQKLPVEIHYPEGSMRCTVDDRVIRIDDKAFNLSDLSRIERKQGKIAAIARNGTRPTGTALILGALKADFGGYVLEVDTFKAQSLIIHPPAPEADRLAYTILVQRGGQVVGQANGTMRIVGHPVEAASRPGASAPPDLSSRTAAKDQTGGPIPVRLKLPTMPDLEFHVLPKGRIAPVEMDPEFNVPRADALETPRQGGQSHAWAILRVLNRGQRKVTALQLQVRADIPGCPAHTQMVDGLGGRGELAPGGVASFAVDFPDPPAGTTAPPGEAEIELTVAKLE